MSGGMSGQGKVCFWLTVGMTGWVHWCGHSCRRVQIDKVDLSCARTLPMNREHLPRSCWCMCQASLPSKPSFGAAKRKSAEQTAAEFEAWG
jgi:hypothetical protein